MNSNQTHNPWGDPTANKTHSSVTDWGMRLPGMIRRAMACIAGHFRRITGWWSARLRLLWSGPGAASRMAAIGLFLAGLVALVILGYLLIYLIPLLIMAAFIAAICSSLALGNERSRRFRQH